MPQVPDDRSLTGLSASPCRQLLPALDRGPALTPLVVLACVLPCVLAVFDSLPGDEAASWQLLAFEAWPMTPWAGSVEGAAAQPASLGLWLTSSLARWVGPASHAARWGTTLLGTIGLSAMVAVLARKYCGWRVAVLALLLMSTHPGLVLLVRNSGPEPLGLTFGLIAWWCFARHLEEPGCWWSISFAGAVLAGVACAVTCGPFALLLLPTLSLLVLTRLQPSPRREGGPAEAGSTFGRAPRVVSLLVLVGVVALIASTLQLVLAANGQRLIALAQLPPGLYLQLDWKWRLAWVWRSTFLWGWVLIGVHELWRRWRRSQTGMEASRPAAVLAWLATGLGFAIAVTWVEPWLIAQTLARTTVLPVLCVVAAVGLDAGLRRDCASIWLLLATGLTLGLLAGSKSGDWRLGLAIGVLVLVVVPTAVAMYTRAREGIRESACRRWLQTCFTAVVLCHVLLGLQELTRQDKSSLRLIGFEQKLAQVKYLDRILVLTPGSVAPAPLQMILRSRWPYTEVVTLKDVDRDAALAKEMSTSWPGDLLIVEWARRESRGPVLLNRRRSVVMVAEPTRYRDRRLAAWLMPQSGGHIVRRDPSL